MRRSLLLVIVIAAGASPAHAQAKRVVDIRVPDAGVVQRLTISDGSQVYGQVEAIEDDSIVFRTIAGASLTVDNEQIAELRIVEGRIVNGEFRLKDPHGSRLFFGPTARTLGRGDGYFALHQLTVPVVQVGVTNRVSIGAGTPLVFFGGDHPFVITPKAQVLARKNVQAAAGLIHVAGIDGHGAGIAYGVATVGSLDNAATLGVAYAYADGGRSPVFLVGAELRESRRVKWFTENWIWGGADGFLSGGVRIMGDRFSADLGIVAPLESGPYLFPLVSFTWGF